MTPEGDSENPRIEIEVTDEVGNPTFSTYQLDVAEPEPEPVPGDGGVGHSWFVVEVVSEHVPPDVVKPPPKPVVLPVSPAKKPRRRRGEDRFPADFRVVETAVDRYRASFEVIAGDRFPATYAVVESGATIFAAQFHRSLRRRNADEEAVMALLMTEEDWE